VTLRVEGTNGQQLAGAVAHVLERASRTRERMFSGLVQMKAVWRGVVAAVLATFAISTHGSGPARHGEVEVRHIVSDYRQLAEQDGHWRFADRPGRSSASAPDLGVNSLGMRFAQIPAGRFEMGSAIGPGEQPVHPVTVAGFWMGTTEVTQAQ
jgi:formylglycine-generating enzyme required for sulfatase activity